MDGTLIKEMAEILRTLQGAGRKERPPLYEDGLLVFNDIEDVAGTAGIEERIWRGESERGSGERRGGRLSGRVREADLAERR